MEHRIDEVIKYLKSLKKNGSEITYLSIESFPESIMRIDGTMENIPTQEFTIEIRGTKNIDYEQTTNY